MQEDGAAVTVTTLEIPDALSDIDAEARVVIANALSLARERLDMEIAWLAEFSGPRKVLRVVEGETDEWGLEDDTWLPAAESYCARMLDGRIPNAIPDTAAEPGVCDLPVTENLRIGAYIGVPLILDDGELRGAFCCLKHTPVRDLDERDVRVMQVLAKLVADELGFRQSLRLLRTQEARNASLQALLAALQVRDDYTADHSHAVVDLAVAVARRLGLDDQAVTDVEQVALLHDLGKVGIPDAILRKPGPLTDAEWEVMRTHPTVGADIVGRLDALAHLEPAIRAEHERWDGTGYPDRLAGEQIPVPSRITLTCDAFHAMVSDRPYRPAMAHDAAVLELRRCAGAMFWPEAVQALVAELDAPEHLV